MGPASKPNPWADFGLGFGLTIAGNLLVGGLLSILVPRFGWSVFAAILGGLNLAALIAVLVKRRPFIAVGMLAVVVLPLLPVGTCMMLSFRF